jgi:arylsulfatase A-like enzyme
MRPNILLVLTDQQRTDTLSCYGARHTHTPVADDLAARGAVFERAYCCNPVCGPARASIFTGKMVSRHGVWNVGIDLPETETLISHRLLQAGYRTHYVGKAHFQTWQGAGSKEVHGPHYPSWTGPYYGFETVELSLGHGSWGLAGHYGEWVRSQVSADEFAAYRQAQCRSPYEFGGAAYDWPLPVRLHSSVWTAERAMHFIDHHDARRPFFLTVSFQDPHHPHCVPADLADRVDPRDVPPPDYTDGELEDKPAHFMEAFLGRIQSSRFKGQYAVAGQLPEADFRKVSEKDAREGIAYYHTLAKFVDQQLGRIVDHLRQKGLADNTLIVFTSDHGELLGDHGIWMKGPFHYEPLVRIPLIACWPAGFGGGVRSGAVVNHLDLAATITAAAGLPASDDMDGTSLLPLCRRQTDRVRQCTLVEHIDDPAKLRLKTIITPDRKLTWYAGQDDGELYDLQQDPREKVNRWSDPAYAADRSRLLGLLLSQLERSEKRLPRTCYV